MKNKYLLLVIIFFNLGFGQFNPNSPWKNLNKTNKNSSFQNDVAVFNTFWETHNKDLKGSGYKPFKRWENKYENQLNPDGTIITPQQIWFAWQQKNVAKAKKSQTTFALPTSNWQPVGPFTHTNSGSWSSGQGRTSAVALDPLDSNIIYVGSPAGGIWKSENAGNTWVPLSDELPQIGITGIAIDHPVGGNTTVYIATGDKDAWNTYSIGVLKSINGGPWTTTGLTFIGTDNQAGDLIIHPTNKQILLCATNNGLYRTTDGGNTWDVEQIGDFSQGSVRFKPNDPTVVYATTNNKFYKSTDTGNNFTDLSISSGLTSALIVPNRLILDITPADNNYVYVLSVNNSYALNGIYKSINSGASFVKTSGTTNILESTQAWYDLALAVSDTDKDLVFTGCLNVWKSQNGGASVTKVNNWSSPESASYTHADIHHLQYINGKLYCLSDGGIYVSTDNGVNFSDKTAGLQISMFYKVAVSKTTASKMVGGLQDNGGHAYSNSQWKNYYGADGMDTAISQVNSDLFYGFIQRGGGLYISNDAGVSNTSSVSAPSGISGNWVTPLKGDSQGNIYSGFNGLYKLVNGNWELQNTNTVGSGNLELISIDPTNDAIIYVTNGSELYKSTNAGVTFVYAFGAPNTITGINVHATNSNIIYVTTAGTDGEALQSTDGGFTFSSIGPGLPDIAKNCIIHQGRNPNNPLYVGTSLGVYYKDDSMTTWEPFDTNLPNVSVTDLEINLEDGKIIAATYGRGIWHSDIPVVVPPIDLKFVSINNPTLNINCDSSVNPQIIVKNSGTTTINSLTINYLVDNTPYTFNWTGNLAADQSETVNLPNLSITKGLHTLSVNVTTTGDAFSDNNAGQTPFYTNDSGVVGTTNTFTNPIDKLLVVSPENGWITGNRTGDALQTDGNTAYLTNLSGNYLNNVKTYLVSQCYNLSTATNPEISFKMAFDLEANWDVAYVEYSTNFGTTWNVLGAMASNWYNSDRTSATSGNDCFLCVGAQWTGSNINLTTYNYPLTSLNTETNIIFRIVFQSDGSVTNLGVKIDDFVISGTLASDTFNPNTIGVYPNPTTGIVTLTFGDLILNTIEVFDLSGKVVHKTNTINNTNNTTNINVADLANGVYFIKITTSETTIVKRIIKQ